MRILRLTPREQRVVSVAVVLFALGAGYRGMWNPYRLEVSRLEDELVLERQRLARELELIAAVADYRRTRARLGEAREGAAARLFDAPDDLAAIGRVAAYVGASARSIGLELDQIESSVPETREEGLVVLGVSIRATGDLAGILAFLHELEAGDRLLRVEAVTVERAENVLTPGVASPLRFSARVTGFRLASNRRSTG